MVAEYTGLSIPQVQQLNFVQYLVWRRDAFIYMLSRTEAGQEYLDNAWSMAQTEPERVKLRKKLGRKEGE